MNRSIKAAGILLVLILAVLYPWVAGKFHVYLLTEIMIYSMLGLSYYLLLGHTGLLSMGHAAYFGIEGYTTALFLHRMPGLPVSMTLLFGAISGLLAGFLDRIDAPPAHKDLLFVCERWPSVRWCGRLRGNGGD